MITLTAPAVVPAWVYEGLFPQADEDRLAALSAVWLEQSKGCRADGDQLLAAFGHLAGTWSGDDATAATARAKRVAELFFATADACVGLSEGTVSAADAVTATKLAINLVLLNLAESTQTLIQSGSSDVVAYQVAAVQIRAVQLTAFAIVKAYETALLAHMDALSFPSDVQSAMEGLGPGAGGAVDGSAPVSLGAAPSGETVTIAELVGQTEHDQLQADRAPLSTDSQAASSWLEDKGGAILALTDTSELQRVITDSLTNPSVALEGEDLSGYFPTDPSSPGSDPAGVGTVPLPPAGGSGDYAEQLRQSATGGFHNDAQQRLDQHTGTSASNDSAAAASSSGGGNSAHPSAGNSGHHTSSGSGSASGSSHGSNAPASGHPASTGTGGGASSGGSTSSGGSGASGAAPISTGGGGVSGGAGAAHGGGSQGGGSQGGAAPMGTGSAGAATALPSAPAAGPGIAGMGGASAAPPASPSVFGGQAPGGQAGGFMPNSAMPGGGLSGGPGVNMAGGQHLGASSFGSAQGNVPGASVPGGQPGSAAPPGGQAGNPGSVAPKTPPQNPSVPPAAAASNEDKDVARGAVIGMLGAAAAAAALTPLLGALHDLRLPIHPNRTLTQPTQFGLDDVPLAPMPMGMGAVLQKVLAPGEADAMITGTVRTVRGLIYSRDQVAHLRTPQQLHDALGLGYTLLHPNGQMTMAFDPNSSSIEVLRANGIRPEDLIVPLDMGVERDDLPFATMTRDHSRPWQGTGEAPGSTHEHPIDEFEILGETAVSVPHLAEIWRLDPDGTEHHLSTYNARSGLWSGTSSDVAIPPGRKVDNGLYAIMADGNGYEAVTLSETHSVLVAYGVAAPDQFLSCPDGSDRLVVPTREIAYMVGVTSLAKWQGARVQIQYRYGDSALIDYADVSRELARSLGFGQIAQGHWLPQWAPFSELTAVSEMERNYPMPVRVPRPADDQSA